MTGRRAGSVLAMLLVVLMALGAGAVTAPAISIERVGPAESGYGIVAMPGGGVARLMSYAYSPSINAQSIQRIDVRGRVHTVWMPRGIASLGAYPTVLTDGSLAYPGTFFYIENGDGRASAALVSVPRVGRARFVRLSDSTGDRGWSPTAVAPDGAAWRARACSGLLSRTAPDGAETRIHLPPRRCRAETVAGDNSAFAFGPDGSVWFASLCQAWIARVPLVGRAHMWRLPARRHCTPDEDAFEWLRAPHPRLLATQDGGVRFEDGRIDARGHLRLDRSGLLPDAIAPDGAEWRVNAREIVRRGRGGRVTRTSVPVGDEPFGDGPRQFVGGAIGPDGRLWYLSAVPVDHQSGGWHNALMHAGAIDAAGRAVDAALPRDDAADVSMQPVAAARAVWLNAPTVALRISVRPPRGSREAQARVTHFLARRGATVWIQVRCSAPPGTFCSGVVKLFASWARIAVHRVRFAVPAGEARAIPLRLTRRAIARLRKQGHLDPYTAIDVGGGYIAGRIHVR